MEKTLILGHLGRMGKSYGKILDSLGVAWNGEDAAAPVRDQIGKIVLKDLSKYERVIIAIPTDDHAATIEDCVRAKVPYLLCEKPLCKSSEKCRSLDLRGSDLRVVCNWSYVLPWRLKPGGHQIGRASCRERV